MSPAKKTNSADYLRMYRQMVRIRTFEDNANQLYLSAKMPGLTHMYSGEEAVAVGICEALTSDDAAGVDDGVTAVDDDAAVACQDEALGAYFFEIFRKKYYFSKNLEKIFYF